VSTLFDASADELYRAPLAAFVEERKRLAAASKRDGRVADAKALASLAKPPLSAWTVNQLYWHERALVDELFDAARALRDATGKGAAFTAAIASQRAVVGRLRAASIALLAKEGHAANDVLLRRVATTLQALAASGSFAPDAPGRLTADRDPLGFEAMAGSSFADAPAAGPLPERRAKGAYEAKPAEAKRGPAEHEAANREEAKPKPAKREEVKRREEQAAKARARREAHAAVTRADAARREAERAAATAEAHWRDLAARSDAESRDVKSLERAVTDARRALAHAKDALDRAAHRADEAAARAAEAQAARDAAAAAAEESRAVHARAKAELARHDGA